MGCHDKIGSLDAGSLLNVKRLQREPMLRVSIQSVRVMRWTKEGTGHALEIFLLVLGYKKNLPVTNLTDSFLFFRRKSSKMSCYKQ
jgi:hypothetical protein